MQQEAQMGILCANTLQARLHQSYGFWNAIAPPIETCPPPPPPHMVYVSNSTPSTSTSKESASRSSYQNMLDRERAAHSEENTFPYTAAYSTGSSALHYLVRNTRPLRTPEVLPFPRVVRPPPAPYSVPATRVVRTESSCIHSTSAVRELHELLGRGRAVS